MMDDSRKEEILCVLRNRIKNFSCPMCHNNKFEVLDGYVFDVVYNDYHSNLSGGKTLPSIALVCTNCGFISKHALGTLGLLDGTV